MKCRRTVYTVAPSINYRRPIHATHGCTRLAVAMVHTAKMAPGVWSPRCTQHLMQELAATGTQQRPLTDAEGRVCD